MKILLTAFIFLIICTHLCSAQDDDGIKVVNGRRFSIFPYERVDTITVIDPVSGDEVQQIRTMYKWCPYSVNGKRILSNGEVTTPVWSKPSAAATFEEDIIQKLNDELSKFPDGGYNLPIRYIVVNKKGRIIYYSLDSMFIEPRNEISGHSVNRKLGADTMQRISTRLDDIFYSKDMRLIPARVKHRKVTAFYRTYFESTILTVNDHKVSIDTARSILPRERRY